MIALAILLFIVAESPPLSMPGLIVRAHVAEAIVTATDNVHEQRVLARIAKLESSFDPAVIACKRRGDLGRAHGAFQIHPRSRQERIDACELGPAARLALARVRESVAACGDLTAYVSGRCGVGLRAARLRTPR